MGDGILSDIIVIDMTEGVAGPYAAMVLSDMGADVVKVERPAGDWSRPADHTCVEGAANAQFAALNRNKRNIGLDVASDVGRSTLARMLAQADVLLSNFRPGAMAKLGFDYPRCREINDQLIWCAISGFGQRGPMAARPASDTIMQAMSGVMSLVGEPDGPPLRVGFPLIDMAAANAAVQAIQLALYRRLKGGGGGAIDVSLMAAATALMSAGVTKFSATGEAPKRQGHQNATLAPAGAFKTGDGRYLSLAILRDSHWRKFCEALGMEALIEDPRFLTNADRVENRTALDEIIQPMFQAKPAAEWIERLRAADILAGPINDYADIAGDPDLAATLPLVDAMTPGVPQAVGLPYLLDGERPKSQRGAQPKGANTDDVLRSFGFGSEEISDLVAAGAAFRT